MLEVAPLSILSQRVSSLEVARVPKVIGNAGL